MEKATSKPRKKLFHRDFTLMVIGQIISLFGNTILRFALPLYLYNQTGSPALLGIVGAVSFIPAILLSPVGGMIADRVNKRNIMVVLDFVTCALVLVFTLLLGNLSLVPLIMVAMMLLFGIQGAYSPSVQASVPLLMQEDQLVQANSVVNLVQSLAQLVGPVLGGLLFAMSGLMPILIISIVCFFVSAVMEIFIRIPHTRQKAQGGMLKTVKSDFAESTRFFKQNPVIGKGVLIVAAFNIVISSMLVVAMPVLITGYLPFSEAMGNQLYGYAEGAMAVGGLLGGLLCGVAGKKIRYEGMWKLLLGAALCVVPIALALGLGLPAMVCYGTILVCGVLLMALATMFTIQILSFTQLVTPEEILGKVVSVIMALCMCAQPIGQALYGVLFENFLSASWAVLLFASAAACVIAVLSRRTFARIGEVAPASARKEAVAAA